MPFVRPSVVRYAAASRTISTRQSARDALHARSSECSLPTLPSCPESTCQCADMPSDLDIDRTTNLNSTMAPYSEHLIISTGQADWKSRIEDERGTAPWGDLVANVKASLGLKGQFHNPYHNVVVSTSSFATPPATSSDRTSQALLFPSFRMIHKVENTDDAVSNFVRTFLLPERLHSAYDHHPQEERAAKMRDDSSASNSKWSGKVHPISAPTILICSHNSRDVRCGVLGPLLHAEFTQYINKRHTLRNQADDTSNPGGSEDKTFVSHPAFKPNLVDREIPARQPINVGMISHIGGHKFAGNVIIYIPPKYQCRTLERSARGTHPRYTETSEKSESPVPHEDDVVESFADFTSPLAGKGIWYGRVEPKHVEGIVEQTIGHGRIIKDLFRGGINQDGSLIRLPLY